MLGLDVVDSSGECFLDGWRQVLQSNQFCNDGLSISYLVHRKEQIEVHDFLLNVDLVIISHLYDELVGELHELYASFEDSCFLVWCLLKPLALDRRHPSVHYFDYSLEATEEVGVAFEFYKPHKTLFRLLTAELHDLLVREACK